MKKIYKVSIWSSLFVEAESKEEAEDIAHDHVIGCLIKPNEFEFDTEIWDDEYHDIEVQNKYN